MSTMEFYARLGGHTMKNNQHACRIAGLLLCLALVLTGCANQAQSPASDGTQDVPPIQFGVVADGHSIDDHTIHFSKASLAEVKPAPEAVVCYMPEKISPETLMEHLNMSAQATNAENSSECVYSNGRYSLEVYANGNFCLFSRIQDPEVREISLSDEECVKIANDFLAENNLLCDDLVLSEKVDVDKVADEDRTIIVSKVVTYHPKTPNDSDLFGNSKVSVRVSADGMVTELIYNHLHYAKCATLPALDPSQALQQAQNQKDRTAIYFEAMDDIASELTIETVRMAYYENVMTENPSRQPVYIFEGGSADGQFAISVSALQR